MNDDQQSGPEPVTILIGGVPLEQYFEQKSAKVRRGELADSFAMFIDKATFAEAMNVLDANLKLAIQGAVDEAIEKQMAFLREAVGMETSEGGIVLPHGKPS